jgi:uncharacterized protein YndB with AHSA1/START domain
MPGSSGARRERQVPATLDVSLAIGAPPGLILKAFFDPDALGAWWQTVHAVTIPRTLGPYAIQWASTEFRDDIFGRLGGVLRGTVMEFTPDQGFLVADLFWLPPDSDPIGPMAFEVTCAPFAAAQPGVTLVRVSQRGFEQGTRWRRYYELISAGWERALGSMKALLEK